MKKIFAIALAAVMVLSMASAFALSDCYANFAWPCDPDVMFCGRGTVEIVPVVKVNNGCGGYEYQINECAGAVASEKVYYAVKLNVEANPDAAFNGEDDSMYWWDATWTARTADETVTATSVVISFNKALGADGKTAPADEVIEMDSTDTASGIDWDADKAKSYYLVNADESEITTEWVDVTDEDMTLADVVFEATVYEGAKASDAKVCAELVSYSDGYGVWYYGDYVVTVDEEDGLMVTKGNDWFVYTDILEDDAVVGESVSASDDEFAAEVNKLFNLNGCTLGTCLTAKNVQKNFGWDTDGKVKDCFQWSAKASAIVDAECVVAIPKTGDASLLAWLF